MTEIVYDNFTPNPGKMFKYIMQKIFYILTLIITIKLYHLETTNVYLEIL